MTRLGFVNKYLKGNRWRLALMFIFAVFAVCLNLVSPLLFSFFIDNIIDQRPITNQFVAGLVDKIGGIPYLRSHLYIGGLLVVFIYLLLTLFLFLRSYLSGSTAEKVCYRIRDDLFAHIQKLPYDYHVKTKTGDLVQRCTSDVDVIRRVLGNQLQQMIRAVFLVILAITIMSRINFSLTIKAVILMPVLFLYALNFFKNNQKAFLVSDESEAAMTTAIQENLAGIRVVKAFGREQYEVNRFAKFNEDFKEKTFHLIKLLGGYWSSSDVICTIQTLIVLYAGIKEVQAGNLTIGNFTVFLSYESMILWPIRMLGRILADVGKSFVSIDRLNEVLNVEEENLEDGVKPEIKGDIVFDNVSFKYDDSTQNVLNNISLHVKPGQTVAIIGPTGSGKSTFVHLLTSLYEVKEGKLLIDGVDINTIQKKYLREKVGIVLQEPFLFSKTIYENIHLNRDFADRDDVEAAARIANVHDVIESFDQGYETLIGEKGVTLSGGQKQRVAIARTIMNDSKILIFDDSLSAVDTETDQQIRHALNQRKKDITTLIITQRINSAKDADLIIVIEEGRITQSGTHDELIKKEGLYKRVYDIQSNHLMEEVYA